MIYNGNLYYFNGWFGGFTSPIFGFNTHPYTVFETVLTYNLYTEAFWGSPQASEVHLNLQSHLEISIDFFSTNGFIFHG